MSKFQQVLNEQKAIFLPPKEPFIETPEIEQPLDKGCLCHIACSM